MQRIQRLAFQLFERHGFRRAYFRQPRAKEGEAAWPAPLRAMVAGLVTPFRIAGFMEDYLREEGGVRLFDVPRPAVVTWERGVGNAADWSRFAQEVLVHHGYEAYLFTALRRGRLAGQMVCAVHDPGSGGWFHISNLGLFGVYEDWDALAADLFSDWERRFVRDASLRLVDERVRPGG